MRKNRLIIIFLWIIVMLAVTAHASWANDLKKVNINKASIAELTQLKRIGPKIAQRIVDYRDTHGPFKMPEDIVIIKGIGPKILELNKRRITIK